MISSGNGRCRSHKVQESAEARLRQTSHRSIQQVRCEFSDGVLTLFGQLPSFYQKQLAQEAVVDLEGVQQVLNQIEVVGSY